MSEPTFARKVFQSFLWIGSGHAVSRVISALAALLALQFVDPSDLGLASLVLALFALLNACNELGLGVALIREDSPTRQQEDSLFWLSLAISSCLCLGAFALAPIIASVYDEPLLVPLIRWNGLTIPLFALSFISRSLLEKELHFDRLAIIDGASLLLSSLTLLYLAYYQCGPWCFIVAEIVNRLSQALLCQLSHPFIPRLSFSLQSIRAILKFGLYATGSRFLFNFYKNIDYLIVGKIFGAHALGLYSLAYKLVWGIARGLSNIVARVALPTFARLRGDMERLMLYYFTLTRISIKIVAVILVPLAVFFDKLLPIFGYEQWLSAGAILRVLAIVGFLQGIGATFPQLLNALGQPKRTFAFSLANAIILPGALWIGAQFSLNGVAIAWVLVYPVSLAVLLLTSAGAVHMKPLTFALRSATGLAMVFLLLILTISVRIILADAWPWITAILGTLLGLAMGCSMLYFRELEAFRMVLKR